MYNKVVLVGHLTRNVELRHSASGTAFGVVGIATNRRWKSQTGEMRDETMFIDLTFFGRTAEIANQYLGKGSKVLVDGRLTLNEWIGHDGMRRTKHVVTVESLKMLDSKGESEALRAGARQQYGGYGNQYGNSNYQNSSYQSGRASQPAEQPAPSAPQPQQQPSKKEQSIPEVDIDEDEIPF